MARTIGEALNIINTIGGYDMSGIDMDNNEPTVHRINHKYREEVIVPIIGITRNVTFLCGKGKKQVITADNVVCDVLGYEEKHICLLEDDIKRLYNISCWEFITRWFKVSKESMDSMRFLVIKLKKVE